LVPALAEDRGRRRERSNRRAAATKKVVVTTTGRRAATDEGVPGRADAPTRPHRAPKKAVMSTTTAAILA
jgi:hypothetical protein